MERIEIYYLKKKFAELMLDTGKISKENIKETHVKMPSAPKKVSNLIRTPEDAFKIYNNATEISNPLSTEENQLFIRDNDTHTSMSVGDIIILDNIIYLCENLGWREIGRTS